MHICTILCVHVHMCSTVCVPVPLWSCCYNREWVCAVVMSPFVSLLQVTSGALLEMAHARELMEAYERDLNM